MASIRERTSKQGETTWAVLYRHEGRQGSETFKVKKTAEKLCHLMNTIGVEEALAIGGKGAGRPEAPTVAELFAEWIEWKRADLTPRVAADYQRNFANWIDPFFGHRPADSVTEMDVQNWVDRHLSKRVGPKTTADHHALLHGLFAWASARKRAIVPRNPCKETDLPKRTKTPPKGLSLQEWSLMRAAAYELDRHAADLLVFLAGTGWRISEATALMVRDIEDDGTTMYIRMSQVHRRGQGLVQGGKSAAASRRIRMLPDCATVIRRRIVGKAANAIVFDNPRSPDGIWNGDTFRKGWWQAIIQRAGLSDRKPTPHWLRHTHVFMCHAAGMSLAEIQRRLGHEDIKTTINTYGRLIDGMDDDVAARLDLLVTGGLPQVIEGTVVTSELPRA